MRFLISSIDSATSESLLFLNTNISVSAPAFSKALGTGIRGFSLREVRVAENELGKPYFILSGRAGKLAEGLELSLSISHEREYAVAMVVAE